jgi:hypothetical protein
MVQSYKMVVLVGQHSAGGGTSFEHRRVKIIWRIEQY